MLQNYIRNRHFQGIQNLCTYKSNHSLIDPVRILIKITDSMTYDYSITWLGASGEVRINKDGDRLAIWTIENFRGNQFYPVVDYYPWRPNITNAFTVRNLNIIWPGNTTVVPVGHPQCGWHYELCQTNSKLLRINHHVGCK